MGDSTCLEIPPYPTGAGPGCILWGDGERLHWSNPPTAEGQILTWNGSEWVPANPALSAPKGKNGEPM